MKITFVLVDFNYVADFNPSYSGSIHLGVAYLSSSLKKAGFEVELIHILKPIEKEAFVDKLKVSGPDLVAFTSFTHQFPMVVELADAAKKALDVPSICGGVHPTIDPEGSISVSSFDMICVGEGERALVELCRKMEAGLEVTGTESIWFKKDGEIIRNPVMSLLEDLDSLPFPDWELFDYQKLTEGQGARLTVLATRGCPYNCSFCSNHRIKQAYPNPDRYVRIRSVENVMEEIRERMASYPLLSHTCFVDDTVGLKVSWLEKFSVKYRDLCGLPICANTRVEVLNNERARKAFVDAGLKEAAIGIESGNEAIRSEVLDRRMTNEQITSAVNSCQREGIRVMTYNILGLPGEDSIKMLDTLKLNARVHPNAMHVSIFQPYPFTELYNRCIESGMLKKGQRINTFFEPSVLKLKDLSSERITFAFRNFYLFVRLYSFCYRLPSFFSSPMERVLDDIFCDERSNRRFDLVRPLLNLFLFPVRNSSRLIKKVSPGFVRAVKTAVRGI